MAERIPFEAEAWLKEIAARYADLPTGDAVNAILKDLARDGNQVNVATVESVFVRSGLLVWFEGYQKREQVAVVSYSGSVLSVPARYGKLVAKDPANPTNGQTHQLALWQSYSLTGLDDLIRTLGEKRNVLSTRVAFFANLRRRWAAECPQLKTAGDACRFLGLEVVP